MIFRAKNFNVQKYSHLGSSCTNAKENQERSAFLDINLWIFLPCDLNRKSSKSGVPFNRYPKDLILKRERNNTVEFKRCYQQFDDHNPSSMLSYPLN